MEMLFDKNGWSSSEMLDGLAPAITHPEWHGLLARFRAERQASRALAAGSRGQLVRGRGSFDSGTAQRLHDLQGASRGVNLNGSANRKPVGGIDTDVAGKSSTGERG